MKVLGRLSLITLGICAFVLGIKQLREPDFWWMLRTGDWILENGTVPHEDVFSYTHSGVSWVNVKWGYEVLLSIVSNLGIEATMLIQAVLNLALVVILYYGIKLISNRKIYRSAFIIATVLLLVACEFRFNGRPEMISYFYTATFLFLFISYYERSGTLIFWLIPMQVLWANFHEAYGTGMVMTVAFTGGYIIDAFVFKAHHITRGSVLNLIFATVGVLLAPAIHPYGFKMIIHPYEIFTQVGDNKFTTELLDFRTASYWQKEAWLSMIFLAFSVLAILFAVKSKRNFIKQIAYEYSTGYLILLAMFFYLSLTAYRNIPFFIIVSFPMLYKALVFIGQWLIAKFSKFHRVLRSPVYGAVRFMMLVKLYVFIVSGMYYKYMDDGRDKYGLKVNPYFHPIGATASIPPSIVSAHNFSDFLVSNYPMWAKKGQFKSYIDLRDLDIFPASFFDHFASLNMHEDSLNMELERTNSLFAMFTRSNFVSLHRKFYNDSTWQLHYADPVAVVFTKVDGKREHGKFEEVRQIEPSSFSKTVTKIFNPFSGSEMEDVNVRITASSYFMSVGDLVRAEAELQSAQKDNPVLKMYGSLYLQKAGVDTANASRHLTTAEKYFTDAGNLNREDWEVHFGLGRVYQAQGDLQRASGAFLKASKMNSKSADLWFELFKVENMLGGNTKKQEEYIGNAYRSKKDDVILQFYYGVILCRNKKCDKGKDMLEELLLHPGLDKDQQKTAADFYNNCN